MKYLALLLLATPAFADNSIHKMCMEKYNYQGLNNSDLGSIATCVVTEQNKIRFAEEDRLWAFLQKNPHYRYPGVALPNGAQKSLSPNWGKPRVWSNSR